jgi:hypothetical protein
MWHRVELVLTDVSEERIASIPEEITASNSSSIVTCARFLTMALVLLRVYEAVA